MENATISHKELLQLSRILPSPAQPYELARVTLSIGDLRYLHRLLSDKYQQLLAHNLPDPNLNLLQLLDTFQVMAYPKDSAPLHKNTELESYLDRTLQDDSDDIRLLLEYSYHGGVSHAD